MRCVRGIPTDAAACDSRRDSPITFDGTFIEPLLVPAQLQAPGRPDYRPTLQTGRRCWPYGPRRARRVVDDRLGRTTGWYDRVRCAREWDGAPVRRRPAPDARRAPDSVTPALLCCARAECGPGG